MKTPHLGAASVGSVAGATRFTWEPAILSSSPVCSPKRPNPHRQRRDPGFLVFPLSSSVWMQCLKSDAVRGSRGGLHPNFPEAIAGRKEDVLPSSLFLCLLSAFFPLALLCLAAKEGEVRPGEEEPAKPKHICAETLLLKAASARRQIAEAQAKVCCRKLFDFCLLLSA